MYCVHDRPRKSCELGMITIGRFDTTCSTTAKSLLSCTTVLLPLLIARAAIAGCGGSMYPHYRLIGPEEHACYAEQTLSNEGKIAKRSHILGYAPRTAVFSTGQLMPSALSTGYVERCFMDCKVRRIRELRRENFMCWIQSISYHDICCTLLPRWLDCPYVIPDCFLLAAHSLDMTMQSLSMLACSHWNNLAGLNVRAVLTHVTAACRTSYGLGAQRRAAVAHRFAVSGICCSRKTMLLSIGRMVAAVEQEFVDDR